MKKVKTTSSNLTVQSEQTRDYIVRIEKSGGAFVARYFKIVADSDVGEQPVATELPAFDSSSVSLLRQLIISKDYLAASAVTSNSEAQEKVVYEIGRHVFRPTIGSNSVVGSGEKYDFPVFVLPFEAGDVVSEPYNHFVESVSVKGEVNRNGRLRGAIALFLLSADNSDSPIDDWTLTYIENQSFIVEDLTGGQWENAPSNFRAVSLLPTIELGAPASIAADGYASVSVSVKRDGSVIPYSGELVVEVLDGYAPTRRINVTNGLGSFRVCALGLQSGESLRVKVGTRIVTGLAAASIPVA